MVKKCSGFVLAVAAVVVLSANAGYSAESGTHKGNPNFRQVPLIIESVFLPDFTEEGAFGKPTERLDMATEYEDSDDVAACLIGAKVAGWAAGYEFMPAHALKKGEKPRDVMAALETDSNVFVLVRVSTRTVDLGQAAIITVLGDAALYQKKTMSPIASAGFQGVEKIDPKEIKGDKVRGEYWMKTVASQFARNFDEKFLEKMQTALDGKKLSEEVTALRASPGNMLKGPNVEVLPGGDQRDPELKITSAKADITAMAYLVSSDGKLCRRWFVGGAGEVDVVLKPGSYSLYVKTVAGKKPVSEQVSHAKFTVENKKRYSFGVQ